MQSMSHVVDPQLKISDLATLDQRLELPPGWRGYGDKDYIDHPDTPRRAAEIEQLVAQLDAKDRFSVQRALLPYEHLLPGRYRGRNQRLGESGND